MSWDGIARERASKAYEHGNLALLAVGRHLRYDHGFSRRRVARTMGVREKWVRDVVEKTDE